MPSPRSKQDDGASLVIVLIFITVFGLIVAGLLTEAGASVAYTRAVTDHEKKVYAADAGVALGIQQLQQHSTLCPVTGPGETIQTLQVNGALDNRVNGLDTKVTCETTSGSTTGGSGYAIYTLSDEVDSLQLQAGDTKEVFGPVHVTGRVAGLNKGLDVKNGDFSQLEANGCNAKADPGVTVGDGYDKNCLTTQPEPPVYAAPGSVPPAAPTPQTLGACKIFYPGTYNYDVSSTLAADAARAFDLTKTNYFATGVYYFRSSFKFTGTGTALTYFFGGQPASYETPNLSQWNSTDCARDAKATQAAALATPAFSYSPSGTGVEFVFGNGAQLTVDNKSRAELFERTADGTQEKASPTVAFVPSTWTTTPVTTWETNPAHTDGLAFAPGADKALVLHGVAYAPEHNIRLKLTNVVDAVAFGGIVAWKAELDSSEGGGGSGLVVNGRNGTPKPRRIIVKATAPLSDATSAGKPVVSTAVIIVENDEDPAIGKPKTVTVESWRTRAPDETL
jgi:Tfp pilus assembly protein PilX